MQQIKDVFSTFFVDVSCFTREYTVEHFISCLEHRNCPSTFYMPTFVTYIYKLLYVQVLIVTVMVILEFVIHMHRASIPVGASFVLATAAILVMDMAVLVSMCLCM